MKTLSIICYSLGCILLIISCFTLSISLTWWLSGIAVVLLIGGCVCQFNAVKNKKFINRH